jgi:hypothetical protein
MRILSTDGLLEHQVSDCGFQIPIDHRQGGEIEGGMRVLQRLLTIGVQKTASDRQEYHRKWATESLIVSLHRYFAI